MEVPKLCFESEGVDVWHWYVSISGRIVAQSVEEYGSLHDVVSASALVSAMLGCATVTYLH